MFVRGYNLHHLIGSRIRTGVKGEPVMALEFPSTIGARAAVVSRHPSHHQAAVGLQFKSSLRIVGALDTRTTIDGWFRRMRKSQALRTNRKYEAGERLSQSADTVNYSAVVLARAFKRIERHGSKASANFALFERLPPREEVLECLCSFDLRRIP